MLPRDLWRTSDQPIGPVQLALPAPSRYQGGNDLGHSWPVVLTKVELLQAPRATLRGQKSSALGNGHCSDQLE